MIINFSRYKSTWRKSSGLLWEIKSSLVKICVKLYQNDERLQPWRKWNKTFIYYGLRFKVFKWYRSNAWLSKPLAISRLTYMYKRDFRFGLIPPCICNDFFLSISLLYDYIKFIVFGVWWYINLHNARLIFYAIFLYIVCGI